jgi:hypothetical protein
MRESVKIARVHVDRRSIVGVVRMPDPVVLAIATAAAGKGVETLISDGRSALGALFRMIRERLGRPGAPSSELDEVLANPADTGRRDDLIKALSRQVAADPGFADELRRRWPLVRAEVDASAGGGRNEFNGSATTVIQAQTINGGIAI